MKNFIYKLIFETPTQSAGLLLGLASSAWSVLEFIMRGSVTAFFTLMFIYGVGLIVRSFDEIKLSVSSFIILLLGSALWSFEAWMGILAFDTSLPSRPIIMPIIFAITALWLLIRGRQCKVKQIINTLFRGFRWR